MPYKTIYGMKYSQFEPHMNNCSVAKDNKHEWKSCGTNGQFDGPMTTWNCYHQYRCVHCGSLLDIDSGD